MAKPVSIEVWNPNGKYRVISTKPMPGTRWINLLVEQGCRVEVIHDLHFLLRFHFRDYFFFFFFYFFVNGIVDLFS